VYHAECFTCGECSKKMTASDAAAYEDKVFCRKCFKDGGYSQKQAKSGGNVSAPTTNAMASKFGGGGNKCKLCEKTVYPAETVSFEKVAYHAECFKCSSCARKMSPSGAATFEDELFCTKCFKDGGYSRKQASTHHAPTGVTSNAMASKFGGGGTKCITCDKTVYAAETLSFEKQAYHADCFKCLHCDKKMTPSTAEGQKQEDGSVKVYCKKCWGELGLNRA
jgi:cysteine/glycine-rich protein